jgi:hypothetical protein
MAMYDMLYLDPTSESRKCLNVEPTVGVDGPSGSDTGNKRRQTQKMSIAEPTTEQVDEVHRLFYEEVYRIFEKYKEEYGYDDRELTYVY